jgi:hypothetical protein
MKRTIIILAALAFIGTTVSAQFFKFGIKTGLNYSQLKFDEVKDITSGDFDYKLSEDDNLTGFHIGLMSRINLFNLYLQPEIYFNTSGGKVLVEEIASGGATTEYIKKIKYNKIDVPVLVGGRLSFLRINAGPVASVILSSDSEVTEIIPEMETLSKSATFGYQVGAGFDLLKTLTFDFRYEGSLSKLGDKLTLGNQDFAFDSRASKFMFSVGFFF